MKQVVHFMNQFFAGQGGEEKTDTPMSLVEGPVGPGVLLQSLLGESAKIVATVYCGDNYFHEHADEASQRIVELVGPWEADLFVAGPAFEAGRYGAACVEASQAIATGLGVFCISAMYRDNPGVAVYESHRNPKVFLFPTSSTAAGMREALDHIADFSRRIFAQEPIGSAGQEGYLPRGIRMMTRSDRRGIDRALDTVLAKIDGRPFRSEVPLETFERVPPAPRIRDLSKATIAITTTTGVVPLGNPDRFVERRNTRWAKYAIADADTMEKGRWEAVHGGINTMFLNENPNLGVPLDVLRDLEKEGVVGALHEYYYVTPGPQAAVTAMQAAGAEMASDMIAAGVDGAIMVPT